MIENDIKYMINNEILLSKLWILFNIKIRML